MSTWSGTAHAHPVDLLTPADEAELATGIAASVEQGRRIRVIGAGHSFSPVALGSGTMVSLDALSGVIAVDAARKRVRLRAGTRLRDVPGLLAPYGLALANQGDVDPQSLAGAISTGTHGTGLGHTGFAGMVTGLTLLTADGTQHELSSESAPEVFDLARLSVGVLGVITEVELACVPAFDLVAHERSESLDALLETFVDRSRTADHLEFYWFPHTDRALVKTNVRVAPGAAAPAGMPAAGPRGRLARLVSEEILDNGGLRAISELGHRIPSLVPALNRLAAAATSNRLYRAPAHEVFVSPRRVRFTEMEYAVPLVAGPEALARIRALIERRRWRISFPIEVRTAAADDVPLSTAYGRESCTSPATASTATRSRTASGASRRSSSSSAGGRTGASSIRSRPPGSLSGTRGSRTSGRCGPGSIPRRSSAAPTPTRSSPPDAEAPPAREAPARGARASAWEHTGRESDARTENEALAP